MADANESAQIDISDDSDIPVILKAALQAGDYILIFTTDGEGGLIPKKILASDFVNA